MTAQLDKRLTQPSASATRGFFARALALILGVGAVAIGVAFGGSFNQSLIGGSSESVQWVQAISKYVSQLASAISIGTLVLAAFALSDKSPALARALRLSAAAAAVWTIAALTNFLFTFLSVSGSALSFDNGFGQSLWLFATDIELGIALAIHLLMAAALTLPGFALAADPAMEKDGMYTDHKGMTLYTVDKDADGKSVCKDQCATNWPPALVADGAKASGDWTIITRDDGLKQWAYKGKPLYAFAKDTKAGDKTGDGFLNGAWHIAK